MTAWYLDSSAALKLALQEAETDALSQAIDEADAVLVGCWLLETEMRRVAHREASLTQEMVTELLAEIATYEVPASLFRAAGLIPGEQLRSLDALHLAAASHIGVDAVLTYDRRMADGARELGLPVLAPA